MKFGNDDSLQRSWPLLAATVMELRPFVEMTDNGWIMYEWPVTTEMLPIIQPCVDEPIQLGMNRWFIGSWQMPD